MAGHLIPSWSFSTWTTFQKCKYRVYLDKVAKADKPPIENTEEKEHPLLRGTRVHDAAELYVNSDVELIKELQKFEPEFNHLKELFTLGQVELEGDWAFTSDWKKTAWISNDAWLRGKLDAFITYNESSCVVVDYKTGKKFGNEVTHSMQGQLYALMAFMRYPQLEDAKVEFWYLDQNEISSTNYTRAKALKFLPTWTQRGNSITNETEFRPNPSNIACKWCPFGSNVGTGVCEHKL